jgi:hypothetical protein
LYTALIYKIPMSFPARSIIRLLTTTLLFLNGGAGVSKAQPSTLPQAPVCQSIAIFWYPQNSETQNIEVEPVAPSFRRRMAAGACERFTLVKQDLISWHLKFGTARSTTAALAYLEQELTRDAPSVEAYQAALEQAWRAALPDLQRAAETEQPGGVNYAAAQRVLRNSAAVGRLRRLVYARDTYVEVAGEYLRAGEEFGSLELLARADILLRAAEVAGSFLQSLERQAPVHGLLYFNVDGVPEDDFRLRMAVQQAVITRSLSDLERAQALIASAEQPFYQRLAEGAYSGGAAICDISEGWSDAEGLESTCRNTSSIKEQLTGYWLNRAMLDLLSGNSGAKSISLALGLLRAEERSGSPRCCGYSAQEDMFRLHVARAEAASREAFAPGDPRDATHTIAIDEAFSEYTAAEKLASPSEAPRRFRQVAEGWLSIWSKADRFVPQAQGAGRVWPQRSRHATYLAAVLQKLDLIATGRSALVVPPPAASE